jgi:uncharacterized protein (DUF2147 family)
VHAHALWGRGIAPGAEVIAARIAVAVLALAAEPALADPIGVWREKDGGTVRIHRCGAGLCARIASVQPRLDPATGRPRTDKNNEDASKRNRPLVGIPVLIGMRPNGAGKWSGRLYDADRGKVFSGHLVEVGPKTIRIEGCALGLCGGEELSRVR